MIRKNDFFKLLILGSLLTGCKDDRKDPAPITAEPIEFTKEAEVYLLKQQTGDTLKHLDIEIADDDYQRETGLMYRSSMKESQGMLFIFEDEQPRGFYMKNTEIPLDLLFLNSQNKVVSISRNAKPRSLETILSEVPAQYVLEINAGLAEEWGVNEGDSLILNRK